MCRVTRLGRAATIGLAVLVAIAPLTAHATSSPHPSLDTVLAAPPSSDFMELTTSPLAGTFTAHQWAQLNSDSATAASSESTLLRDGFVEGYGKTWAQASSGHGLVEAVMAFSGGRGATEALRAMEKGDKSDANYVHADTMSGLGTYYGAHIVVSANSLIEDLYGFVKGNDVFAVLFVSTKDDVADLAVQQARAQYESAPGSTIPTSEWPENVNPAAAFPIAVFGVGVGVIVIVAGLVAFLLLRRRTASMPSPYASFAPALSLHMSPDGNYWWDGQAWRDAAQEVPPQAQRSGDGVYWWDGTNWRPVHQPPIS